MSEPDQRLVGVDVARALAVLGMFAVHVGPTGQGGLWGTLYALPHGRAAIAFALLAGVGVGLLARRRGPGALRVTLAWRAGLLLVLGLALQRLDHGVLVVLADYALLFAVAALLVGPGERLVGTLAVVALALGPLGHWWGQRLAPAAFERTPAEWGQPVGEMLHSLILSGPYPLVTWLGPFLAGWWLVRRDWLRRAAGPALLAAGAAVAVLTVGLAEAVGAWSGETGGTLSELASVEAHSQRPLWLWSATASALGLLGAALWACGPRAGAWWPLQRAGQLALTIYVVHLLALHAWTDVLRHGEVGPAALSVLGMAAVSVAFAVAWPGRGPLERLLRPWAWTGIRRL